MNKTALEKLNYLFDTFNHLVEGSFHTALWQLMINKVRSGFDSAFVYIPVPSKSKDIGGTNMGIADRNVAGYTPLPFAIKKGISDDVRREFLDKLNEMVFNLTSKEAMHIEMSSYAQQNRNDGRFNPNEED